MSSGQWLGLLGLAVIFGLFLWGIVASSRKRDRKGARGQQWNPAGTGIAGQVSSDHPSDGPSGGAET